MAQGLDRIEMGGFARVLPEGIGGTSATAVSQAPRIRHIGSASGGCRPNPHVTTANARPPRREGRLAVVCDRTCAELASPAFVIDFVPEESPHRRQVPGVGPPRFDTGISPIDLDRPRLSVNRTPEPHLPDIRHKCCGCRQHQISDHESNRGTTKMPQHDAVRAQLRSSFRDC